MVDLLVTYLEMTAPPAGPALPPPLTGAAIAREPLDADSYLALYRAVGDAVQWDDRLRMTKAALDAFLRDPTTHIYVLRLNGAPVGLCEFDGVGKPETELTNFGLVPDAQGRRLGPWLLDHALRDVWVNGPRRIWLHTDTNDHPDAEAVYRQAGFEIFRRRMETFPD
ncbi:MAG: GNAT family N-acetyltransferase [Rhodospirillaceae bacterium]|nr:GNAT family N-acetyltransferase [Rhodospirillaceae bacterium]